MYRRKMRLLFKNWKLATDDWGKERIVENAKGYESNQRGEILEHWEKKVDALKLYMA